MGLDGNKEVRAVFWKYNMVVPGQMIGKKPRTTEGGGAWNPNAFYSANGDWPIDLNKKDNGRDFLDKPPPIKKKLDEGLNIHDNL